MPGPTIAEMQLRIDLQGLGKVKQLQDALERVGSRYITSQLNEQAKALLGIPTAAQKAAERLAATEARLKRTFGGSDILGGVAKFGIAAMTIKRSFDFIGDSVKGAIDPLRQFQKNLAEVRIKGGAEFTPTAMASISEGIKNRVRAGSMFTPQAQAQAGVDLAASGLSPQAVNTMIPTVLRFAQASGISTVDSSKILTNVANQFQLKTSNFAAIEKLGDQLVAAANASTIGVMDIFNSLKYAGTLANTAKMDPAQVLAMTAVMGNRGIVGSRGGTGMRSLLSRLSHPVHSKAATAQLAMLGMTQKDLQEGLANPEALLQRMGAEGRRRGLSPAKMLSVVSTAFGQYGSTSADVLMKALQGDAAGAAIRGNIKAGPNGGWVFDQKNAVTELETRLRSVSGTMREAADIAGDTLDGRFAKLNSRMQLLQITLGERFLPSVEKSVAWIDRMSAKTEKWVSQNPKSFEKWNKLLENFGTLFLKLSGALAPVAGYVERIASAAAALAVNTASNQDGYKALSQGQGAGFFGAWNAPAFGDDDYARMQFTDKFKRDHPEMGRVEATTRAWMEWDKQQAAQQKREAAANQRIADRVLGGPGSEIEKLGNLVTGSDPRASTSTVAVRVSVDDRGQLKAMVDRLTKGREGPELRTESSVNL